MDWCLRSAASDLWDQSLRNFHVLAVGFLLGDLVFALYSPKKFLFHEDIAVKRNLTLTSACMSMEVKANEFAVAMILGTS